jgi:hypothetical protein
MSILFHQGIGLGNMSRRISADERVVLYIKKPLDEGW